MVKSFMKELRYVKEHVEVMDILTILIFQIYYHNIQVILPMKVKIQFYIYKLQDLY